MMGDTSRLDAIAARLLTAERANRGVRHLANAAVEIGEMVDTAGAVAILSEYRQAYREVHDVLTNGDPADIVYLASQLDPS